MKSVIKKPQPLATNPTDEKKNVRDCIYYPVNKEIYKDSIKKIIEFNDEVSELFFTIVFWCKKDLEQLNSEHPNWGLTIKFYPPGESSKKRAMDYVLKLTWYSAFDENTNEFIALKPASHCQALANELSNEKFQEIYKIYNSIINKK
jgi:hypothetical protein